MDELRYQVDLLKRLESEAGERRTDVPQLLCADIDQCISVYVNL